MNFNKKYKTIFLDASTPRVKKSKTVNIILSPSLYWVKKLLLPVQKTSEVKKLLKSIFEETLPEGHYSYSVYQDGDHFFAFAYDDKLIIDLLEQKGIKVSNVAGVYFAQKELSFIETATKISDTQSILLKGDILILLPNAWVAEDGNFNIDNIKLSDHRITLSRYGNIIDTQGFHNIVIILVISILLYAGEWVIINSKISEYSTKKEALFKKAKLKSTMFQNKAMLKKYTKIHTKQISVRDLMSIILSTKLKPSESLTKLIYKDKKLTAYYNAMSKQTINTIKQELRTKKIRFKSDMKEKYYVIEMIL
jgi:hypothetical protein